MKERKKLEDIERKKKEIGKKEFKKKKDIGRKKLKEGKWKTEIERKKYGRQKLK